MCSTVAVEPTGDALDSTSLVGAFLYYLIFYMLHIYIYYIRVMKTLLNIPVRHICSKAQVDLSDKKKLHKKRLQELSCQMLSLKPNYRSVRVGVAD